MMKEEARIEEILSSKGIVRILRVLAEEGEMNITQIVRKAALNHSSTVVHLNKLTEAGLVKEKRFGKIRIYEFRRDNAVAQKIAELMETWRREMALLSYAQQS